MNFRFDETFAHKMEAGADMTLMPSRYEPSGLTQMYSLRYGTVPIVRSTGGLADTVRSGEDGNGFCFDDYRADALVDAVRNALEEFSRPEKWQIRMRRGMTQDMNWNGAAQEYIAVYEQAIAAHALR